MHEISSLTQKRLPSQLRLWSECWLFGKSDLQIHKYKTLHKKCVANKTQQRYRNLINHKMSNCNAWKQEHTFTYRTYNKILKNSALP
jgi:hypothetical protein